MRIHRSVIQLSAAHFLIDNYSSMLGAFLPFLHRQLGLSLSQAGLLGGALIVSSSLLQPAYGILSDKFQNRAFTALAPAVAGIFLSGLGMASDFSGLLLLVVLGGAGIASFHPQGAALASGVSERHRGFYLSFFISAGLVGYSVGPIFITAVILYAGMGNSYLAAIPGILMSVYLFAFGPRLLRGQKPAGNVNLTDLLKRQFGPLFKLYLLVIIRSFLQLAFVAFLPLYLTTQGYTEMRGSQNLSLFLLAGGIASFVGGALLDRMGGRRVLALSMLGSVPFLIGFLYTGGIVSTVLCTVGGGILLLSSPVNVAMAQQLVPMGAGTVSALMMGFAWGVGGLLIPAFGVLSDWFTLQIAFLMVILLALPGYLLALTLPEERKSRGRQLDQARMVREKGESAL